MQRNYRVLCFFIVFLFSSILSFSQTVKLAGKIVDAETGAPLVGASIVINGTSKGTVADVEGRFFLQMEKGKQYSLKISSVGYQSKDISEVSADGNTLEISLQKTTGTLEAVVVSTS